jgi:hypothetical protein
MSFIISVLLVFLIFVLVIGFVSIFFTVYGQQATKAPEPVITPTPVPTPTPTSPNPNLQYLPQKAYVQSYAPEVGIPSNSIPLQPVPTVIPQPVAATSQTIGGFDISDIFSTIVAAGSGLAAKMGWDRAKKVDDKVEEKVVPTVQSVAEHQVKQDIVSQKQSEQIYENMADKGVSIQDKPEIKLENLAKLKDEAVKTASKA